jgi:5-methylcytosine-specific restriction endonuclease McrA
MNTYSDSNGKRYTTPQIEGKIRKVALEILYTQYVIYGYNFCQRCKRNDDKPIDISHTISRKAAKENGNVEILWDKNNLEILGRNCHKIKDKLV